PYSQPHAFTPTTVPQVPPPWNAASYLPTYSPVWPPARPPEVTGPAVEGTSPVGSDISTPAIPLPGIYRHPSSALPDGSVLPPAPGWSVSPRPNHVRPQPGLVARQQAFGLR